MQLPDFNNWAQIAQNLFTSACDPSPRWASREGPEPSRSHTFLPVNQNWSQLHSYMVYSVAEITLSRTGTRTPQTKWTYTVNKANACNHDSGFCNGLQGSLRKDGRLPKDLFKDRISSTTAITGDIRISKFWGFVWFIGWVLLVFLVLPALLSLL